MSGPDLRSEGWDWYESCKSKEDATRRAQEIKSRSPNTRVRVIKRGDRYHPYQIYTRKKS